MRKAGLPAVALERRVESSLNLDFASWNQMVPFVRRVEQLRAAI